MMQPRYLFVFLTFWIVSISSFGQNLRLPAEWEPQDRVYVSWYGNERRDTVLCRVVQALQPVVPVSLIFPDSTMMPDIRSTLHQYAIDTTTIAFEYDPYVDFWTRDPFMFVKDGEALKVVDFNYTMYGLFPDILNMPIPDDVKKIGEYDQRLAMQLNLPIIQSDYVFEGGGIESNGNGTLMIIKEMALQRNPGKSLDEIESELVRVLGAKKIIWLKDGLIEDQTFHNLAPFYKNYFGGGANRHVDELCRFVDEQTVVLPYIDKADIHHSAVDSINFGILEANYKLLQEATTAQGKRLTIHRIPMPEIEQLKYSYLIDSRTESEFKEFGFSAGDTIYRIPAASYMNYFVTNKKVLIPKYWQPGMTNSQKEKDEAARSLYQQLFPDREVVQIYTLSINRGGGGIHCMTHEKFKM